MTGFNVNYQYAAKKYIFDILQERYEPNEIMITRLAHFLTSEKDVKDFCQIVADAFSQGYVKAVNDYKEQLNKVGYQVKIVGDTKN